MSGPVMLFCGRQEVESELKRAVHDREIDIQVTVAGSMAALLKSMREPAPDYVLIDAGGFDDMEHANLRPLLRMLEGRGIPLSVFFDRLDDSDIRDIVFGPIFIDQALEVRSDSDVQEAIETILDHVMNRTEEAVAKVGSREDGLTEVGSIYTIGPREYTEARTRSLVSHNMGGFSAALRAAVAQLKKYPLRSVMPWDASDGSPDRKVSNKVGNNDGTSWSLDSRTDLTPNLESVMNAFASDEARARLAGDLLEDLAWRKAWKTKPPMLLLTGESGTGKTLVAQVIADLLTPRPQGTPASPRFEKINSAGLTLSGFEHKVHGAAPRSWSGIDEAVIGQLTHGAHGVVFFDEIGDLQSDVQAALLTFLDERLIRPFQVQPPFNGYQHIIAATNRDLEEGANQQWFRNDLLARFTLRLEIPPLRDRGPGEIRQLVDFLLQDPGVNSLDEEGVHAVSHITNSALDALCAAEYRNGNFRELADVTRDGIRHAMRRYSTVLALDDLRMSPDSHFRSDKDSNRIRVFAVAVPEGSTEVVVSSDAELRLGASRERRTVVTDENGRSWVLPQGAYYRTRD